MSYQGDGSSQTTNSRYETDILVIDLLDDQTWVPRVVVECKLGSVTTHDALTYSTKASTHKHVHPYLRYGIAIGNWGDGRFPPRLLKHGAYFDFMLIQSGIAPSQQEWPYLIDTLTAEVRASRDLQAMLARTLTSGLSPKLIHRQLLLK